MSVTALRVDRLDVAFDAGRQCVAVSYVGEQPGTVGEALLGAAELHFAAVECKVRATAS